MHATAGLLVTLLLIGCVTGQPADVQIRSEHIQGHGVVVAPGVVLTAAHVAPGEPLTVSYRGRKSSALVVKLIPGYPEPLVVIHVTRAWILPKPVSIRRITAGDSGGGLYDADGYCVGVIYGLSYWPLSAELKSVVGILLPEDPSTYVGGRD